MKSKNWILYGVIAICFILAVVVGIMLWNHSRYQYEIAEIKHFSYQVVYTNGKYGVINEKGDIVVDANYDVIQIPNPEKAVFICMKDYQAETKEYTITVLSDKQAKLFAEYERVEAIPLQDDISDVPYEKTVLRYRENGKYGLIDMNGKVVKKAEYDEIQSLPTKEGILKVVKDGKTGVINIKGTTIIKPEFDVVEFDNYYQKEIGYENAGFIVCVQNGNKKTYGYYDAQGKKILNTEYDKVSRILDTEAKDAMLIASKDGKVGVFQNKTNKIKLEYDKIEYDRQTGLYLVTKEDKQGVLNENGKAIIKVEQNQIEIVGEYITTLKDGNITRYDKNGASVKDVDNIAKWSTDHKDYDIVMNVEQKYGLQKKNGDTVIKCRYLFLEYLWQDYFIAKGESGKVGVITPEDKSIVELKYDAINKIEDANLFEAIKNEDNEIDLYNTAMNRIASFVGRELKVETVNGYLKIYTEPKNVEYYTKDGVKTQFQAVFPDVKMIAKQKDDKWGFTDLQGNLKVEYIYDEVTDVNEYGFAGVKKDGKWGVVNQTGEVILEPTYEIDYPSFIGKYYRVLSLIAQPYYTDCLPGEEAKPTEEVKQELEIETESESEQEVEGEKNKENGRPVRN